MSFLVNGSVAQKLTAIVKIKLTARYRYRKPRSRLLSFIPSTKLILKIRSTTLLWYDWRQTSRSPNMSCRFVFPSIQLSGIKITQTTLLISADGVSLSFKITFNLFYDLKFSRQNRNAFWKWHQVESSDSIFRFCKMSRLLCQPRKANFWNSNMRRRIGW